jgi:hypothetical protein
MTAEFSRVILNGLWRGLGCCAEEFREVVHRAWTLARTMNLESDLPNWRGTSSTKST